MKLLCTFSAKQLIKHLVGCISISFLLFSCIDDEYDLDKKSGKYTFNPKLALTIGHTTFRVDSILSKMGENEYIHSTDSGLVYIVYDKDLEFYRGEDRFAITDAQVDFNFTLNTALFSPAVYPSSGQIIIDSTVTYPMLFGPDQRIDSMDLKNMILQTTIASTVAQRGNLTITYPGITRGNTALSDIYTITAGSFNQTHQTNAAGHKLRFKNIAKGISNFTFRLRYVLQGAPGTAVGPGILSVNLKTSDIQYYILYGYVGKTNLLNITDSIDLSIFSNDITNKVQWKDPRLTLNVDNSYVILPIKLTLDSVTVHSKVNNTFKDVTLSPNPVFLQYPVNGGQVMLDSVVYTKPNNPDFFSAVESAPDYIKFHLDANSNPDGDVGLENIIIDTSTIKVKTRFYLPLWFRSGEFGTADTMDFDLKDNLGSGLDSIEAMLFRIVSENGMPIDMRLQVYFADSNLNVIDSIFKTKNNKVLTAGKLDNNDKVTAPTRNVLDLDFSKSQLRSIIKTKKLLIKVYANTADYTPVNGRYVKFFKDYKFKLTFACQFNAKISREIK